MILPYKIKTVLDSASVYAPYIPLQTGKFVKWEKVGKDMPTNRSIYKINFVEVAYWVEMQSEDMWKSYRMPIDSTIDHQTGQCYLFTETMEVLFLMRWS